MPDPVVALTAPEIIRIKRDGGTLAPAQIEAFVRGLVDGRWSEGQAAALAMAVLLRGMDRAETVALTRAMTHSGRVLDWRAAGFEGPVLDKHSTGGVGDKVSLMLAPMVAACGAAAGAIVPMISGRGLAHTGGTLDKLEALPGYRVEPDAATLQRCLRQAGCAIVGASAELAPADRRLYAIRDVTATVESVPLITASILSKKLAAGLHALVLDVKCGSGAFAGTPAMARALATSLVEVARGAGLAAEALITDMNGVLGTSAGHTLELAEAWAYLRGTRREPRLHAVTLALAGTLLATAGLAADADTGARMAEAALAGGAAAERFERMVATLGGPADLHSALAALPVAPVVRAVPAPRRGFVAAIDARALGLAVVALGGGRLRPGDCIDPRVGLAEVAAPGAALHAGEPLAFVHAADEAAAAAAVAAVQAAITLDDAPAAAAPLISPCDATG